MDFWGKHVEDIKLMHEKKMYPPKVTIMVYTKTRSSVSQKATVTVEIKGTRDDEAARVVITRDFSAGKQTLMVPVQDSLVNQL